MHVGVMLADLRSPATHLYKHLPSGLADANGLWVYVHLMYRSVAGMECS